MDLHSRIRSNQELAHTPILVITSDAKQIDFGGDSTKDDLLEASYQPITLVAKVARLVERKRTQDELRSSQQLYFDLFHNANDVVYTHDLTGRYTSLNAIGQQITGYKPEEIADAGFLISTRTPDGSPSFHLYSTENPLPHILEQLRHLQVHLTINEMSDRQVSPWLKNVPEAQPVDVRIWTISDLTNTQLKSLRAFRNEKHYTATQAAEMVNWVNTRQTDFGIHDLIHRGLVEVAERIVAIYLPQNQAAGQ